MTKYLLCLLPGVLWSQPTSLSVQPATATQGVVNYYAPDTTPCSRTVTQNGAGVNDVNTSLFANSNLDSRPGDVTIGKFHSVVIGTRDAEVALDGTYKSRALQADTDTTVVISCTGGSATAFFHTRNPPLGHSFADPLPVDPNVPGTYAFVTPPWTSRIPTWVDPQTGFLTTLLGGPGNNLELNLFNSGNPQVYTSSVGTGWTNPTNLLSNTCCTTYIGTGAATQKLLITFGLNLGGPDHNSILNFVSTINPNFTAWCSDVTSCTGASADDRTINYCLTIDGVNCVGKTQTAVLVLCAVSCSTAPASLFTAFVSPALMMADWFTGQPTIDSSDLSTYTGGNGGINRTGTAVTAARVLTDTTGTAPFNMNWTNGTVFIEPTGSACTAGSPCTINSVQSPTALTLNGSPASFDSNVDWKVSAAGILVWRKTATATGISVQSATYALQSVAGPLRSDNGDEDQLANCASNLVVGPASELGYHCAISGNFMWIGKDTLTVNRIGRSVPTFNGGTNGWNSSVTENGGYWDRTDPNTYYGTIPIANAVHNKTVMKFTYTGGNTDIGDLSNTTPIVPCGSSPCWTITSLTSSPNFLDVQFSAFNPVWASSGFKNGGKNGQGAFDLIGTDGGSTLFYDISRDGNQNLLAFICGFNVTTGLATSCGPSWANSPMTWGGIHGPGNMNSRGEYMPVTYFRGPNTGTETLSGNGPYYSTVTSGGISGTGTTCPAQPGGNTLPNWPTGANCLIITVDGEPGDPTPNLYAVGTVTTSGTSVTGAGTSWNQYMDQCQMHIGSTYYTFTFVDATHGTLSGSPGVTGSAYILYMEPVNSGLVGPATFAYLKNAQPGEYFCIVATGTGGLWNHCGDQYYPASAEIGRLLIKSADGRGATWTAQRGYAGLNAPTAFSTVGASAQLFFIPGTCDFAVGAQYPCASANTYWDTIDTTASNPSGTTVMVNSNDTGCCHAAHQGVQAEAAGLEPSIDGSGTAGGNQYFAIFGAPSATTTIPAFIALPHYLVNRNPTFNGKLGLGAPNQVDRHAGHNQFVATTKEFSWVHDGAPVLGDDGSGAVITGSAASPGTNVSGALWKFVAAQVPRLRPHVMPTLAKAGWRPLLDVSGASSVIGGTSGDSWKWCYANAINECVSGSTVGDVYVNAPGVNFPYCTWPGGVGNASGDLIDICVTDMGGMTSNNTQTVLTRADPIGQMSRRVSSGQQGYLWLDQFWNNHATPDGHFLISWSAWLGRQLNAYLMTKLPPIPSGDAVNRGDYVPVPVGIPTATIAGASTAAVQYGYTPSFFCTSRQEKCIAGSTFAVQWSSETPSRVACTADCKVIIPAVSNRILYYQTLVYNSGGSVIFTGDLQILATP